MPSSCSPLIDPTDISFGSRPNHRRIELRQYWERFERIEQYFLDSNCVRFCLLIGSYWKVEKLTKRIKLLSNLNLVPTPLWKAFQHLLPQILFALWLLSLRSRMLLLRPFSEYE
jgi:hypothetical protein